jgi:hypothetical protein
MQAVEKLRLLLSRAHVRHALYDLTRSEDGRLIVWDTHEFERFNPTSNKVETVYEQVPTELGTITGLAAVANTFDIGRKLKIETDRLKNFNHGEEEAAQEWALANAWDYPADTAAACFRLRNAATFRRKVEDKIKGVLAFFTEANFQTLARLGHDPRNPIELYASTANGAFKIGRTLSEAIAIRPDFTILDRMPPWPELKRP